MSLAIQILSLIGAAAILAAFSAIQFRWMNPNGLVYLLLNAIGAGILVIVAWVEQQWGFLLLESVWTLVSVYALLRLIPGR